MKVLCWWIRNLSSFNITCEGKQNSIISWQMICHHRTHLTNQASPQYQIMMIWNKILMAILLQRQIFMYVHYFCHKPTEAASRSATLFKKDFGTGVFLWILPNFLQYLLLQNTSGKLLFSLILWKIYYASQSNKWMGLLTWCKLIKLRHVRRPIFSLDWLQIKIAAENNSWIHAVENNCSITEDLELQLIFRVKVKMLCENLKNSDVTFWW